MKPKDVKLTFMQRFTTNVRVLFRIAKRSTAFWGSVCFIVLTTINYQWSIRLETKSPSDVFCGKYVLPPFASVLEILLVVLMCLIYKDFIHPTIRKIRREIDNEQFEVKVKILNDVDKDVILK
jgi:hypothetical protein